MNQVFSLSTWRFYGNRVFEEWFFRTGFLEKNRFPFEFKDGSSKMARIVKFSFQD